MAFTTPQESWCCPLCSEEALFLGEPKRCWEPHSENSEQRRYRSALVSTLSGIHFPLIIYSRNKLHLSASLRWGQREGKNLFSELFNLASKDLKCNPLTSKILLPPLPSNFLRPLSYYSLTCRERNDREWNCVGSRIPNLSTSQVVDCWAYWECMFAMQTNSSIHTFAEMNRSLPYVEEY